jgi:hypothetical protein
MVKHFIEFRGSNCDATWDWPNDPRNFSANQYIEGSRTYDTCRFATTNHFPLKLEFTDATNAKHTILIEASSDQLTVAFPCSSEILWHGDERDRTGLDAQTNVAKVSFSYTESTFFHSHGIRLETEGYRATDMTNYASDTESWTAAVGLFVKCTEGVRNLAEAYSKIRGHPGK